jgi:hypothetical protein
MHPFSCECSTDVSFGLTYSISAYRTSAFISNHIVQRLEQELLAHYAETASRARHRNIEWMLLLQEARFSLRYARGPHDESSAHMKANLVVAANKADDDSTFPTTLHAIYRPAFDWG